MNKEKEIDMLKEKLDYYTLVATDEEFDAEEVIKIVKRLEELEPTEHRKNLSMNFWTISGNIARNEKGRKKY